MEQKISHIRGCFDINSDFYFCTFLHIYIYFWHDLQLILHVQLKLKSRSCFMCEVTIPNLWADISKCSLTIKSIEDKKKKIMLTINNLSSEKTKQRSHVLTCSHWSYPHKMSHLAMCIFHIHETCYWQILPMRNNKAFLRPLILQLLSNVLFSFICRSSDVSSSGPLIARKRLWVFACEE